MMESYEETRIGNSHSNDCAELHEVMIHESTLAADHSALVGSSKQNFDFGAEIVEKQIIAAVVREGEIKTNGENITTTATEATLSIGASNLPVEIETPLNVAELQLNKVELGPEQVQSVCSTFDSDANCASNKDDDTESYQSDENADEEEEDIDDSENSQLACNRNRNISASQESDESSSDSDFSDLSGLSDMSGREWKPISTRPINWVQKQIHAGANPRALLSQMLPSNAHQIASGVNDMMLWRILASMLSEPPRRQKLRYINTFEDVIQLVQQSQKIIVLTGAGVSVSCGIPDFRSSDGIYSRLAKDFPNLPDPQAMFDINYFQRDPRPFYKFAREIYPGQFKPSPCHRFIKLLEQKEKLLRNYTQNIDTLEQVAGIKNVIECHGSFSTASCTKCKIKCTADAIREDIFAQRIPVCRRCQPNVKQSVNASDPVSEMELQQVVENGIMKPDIVFFGEGLPEEFHTVMASDKDKCDLLIVIGSSLKVRPVALIPSSIPANVPQILINREQLHHLEFDVELLGDSDVIINQLCHRLGDDWKDICVDDIVLKESKELVPLEANTTEVDEDGNQLLDTDTLSVKSSASTDIALRSAGTYSDSGFESSTSSGMVVAKTVTAISEANETIEKIKNTMMEFNSPTTKTKSGELRSPEYLGEPTDAVDYDNRSFHSFTARMGVENASYNVNARHLSIDSSKDSGICDASNSAVISSSVASLAPPVTKFGDSGGTSEPASHNSSNITPVSTHSTHVNELSPSADTSSNMVTQENEENSTKNVSSAVRDQENKKHLSAADRLLEGTYYCHESSSSYVFPGAQVSWWSDSEGEDEDNENAFDDDETDINGAPLSPLMPPSVEAEVVNEISTTSAFSISAKRPLPTISNDTEPDTALSINTDTRNTLANPTTKDKCNSNSEIILSPKRKVRQDSSHDAEEDAVGIMGTPPPQKRKRFGPEECIAEPIGLDNLTETTAMNRCTIACATSNGKSFECFQTSSTAATNETLLPQF